MQSYAKAAKELLDSVAKMTIRQEPPWSPHSQQQQQQQQQQQPLVLQASESPRGPRPALPVEARVSRFKQELLASRINLEELRRLAAQGVPDRDGLRAMTWKLLLGYLPPDPSEWDAVLTAKRREYRLFCQDLIVDPKKAEQQQQQQQQQQERLGRSSSSSGGGGGGSAGSSGDGDPGSSSGADGAGSRPGDPLSSSSNSSGAAARGDPLLLELKAAVPEDHPLSLQATSKWHTFFKDNEILEQITRDVMRTHPDMHFFSGDGDAAALHREELTRCLFMFAKLNPGLRYIQGMNELLAPLYYLFKTDPDAASSASAEADAFYCFVDLLSEFRDHFCASLDNSASGIRATIARLVALLRAVDAELADHLEKHRVDPHMFAFRWITLLLTQEFPFPDALRIWDSLLSDGRGRLDALLRVCVALLVHVRAQLLEGDFTVIVKTLQRYPSVDVDVILREAARLPPVASVVDAPPL